MGDADAFFIMAEKLRFHHERPSLADLRNMTQMRFHRVDRASLRHVIGIHANERQERIRRVPEDVQIPELRHVAVVIHPVGQHGRGV